eukprot:1151997-Rhodomonas_salina.1
MLPTRLPDTTSHFGGPAEDLLGSSALGLLYESTTFVDFSRLVLVNSTSMKPFCEEIPALGHVAEEKTLNSSFAPRTVSGSTVARTTGRLALIRTELGGSGFRFGSGTGGPIATAVPFCAHTQSVS